MRSGFGCGRFILVSMRYSLLDFIECPISHTELTCIALREAEVPAWHVKLANGSRINQPGAIFGPTPRFRKQTWLTEFLQSHACDPAPASRNETWVVQEGLLISGETGRWYPIRNFVPELLPDRLRDFERDFDFLKGLREQLPPELFERLHDKTLFSADSEEHDGGLKHKMSEMSISEKVRDDDFFGPGYIAPFNPGACDHTAHLIKLFSLCLSFLSEGGQNKFIVDAGCGYSWTTEWLYKIGFEPIGVDITRTYLDIAVERTGTWLPHLIRADTENLPLKSDIADAILCYEAFHHISERNKAMKGFFRVLKPGKRVVLAEPGADHETVQHVIDVMQKYGILERGMDLSDVENYTLGTGFMPPKQHYVVELNNSTPRRRLLKEEGIKERSLTNSNLFTIEKPLPPSEEDPVPQRSNFLSTLAKLVLPRRNNATPRAAGS